MGSRRHRDKHRLRPRMRQQTGQVNGPRVQRFKHGRNGKQNINYKNSIIMKAWSIIWGILAAACLIAVFCGATQHFWTFGISAAMCLAFRAEDETDETDEDDDSHGSR